jgi:hypothetical protein
MDIKRFGTRVELMRSVISYTKCYISNVYIDRSCLQNFRFLELGSGISFTPDVTVILPMSGFLIKHNGIFSLPGGKAWPGRDADHSPPSSAEVKYE